MKQNKKTQDKIKNLPTSSGCYLFKAKRGEVIYVGKAKNLRNRVRSYWQKNEQLTAAKMQMVEEVGDLDYVIVDSEKEALLLEANLIKKHKPKYNVILKDDKSFLYIRIDYSKIWPEIYWVRKPNLNDRRSWFFGPYTSAAAARSTLEAIKRIFPLCGGLPRRGTPTLRRGCFRYQIGRCMGPCVGETSPDEYKKIFPKIIQFLKGNWAGVIKDLKKEMTAASDNQQYERAAKLRDQIEALEKTLEKQKVISTKKVDQDYVSLYIKSKEAINRVSTQNIACINLFKVRDGKLIDKQNFILKNVDGKMNVEILEEFMDQYYTMNTDMPKEIVLPDVDGGTDVETQNFASLHFASLHFASLQVKVIFAKRGKKLRLLKMGQKNAQEYLKKQMASWQKQEQTNEEILNNLKKILNLPKIPKRIECYDISNIQGAHAVGSMVVFTDGEPDKSQYRKFKIKIDGQPNDVGMMKEILGRRFGQNHKNTEDTKTQKHIVGAPLVGAHDRKQPHDWPMPDLIVVDGGRQQLNTVHEILNNGTMEQWNNNSKPSVMSLAKRNEEIFTPHHKEPIILNRNSGELKLLQRLRDEAHRFGIGYYRKRHRKEGVKSVLDNIPGVGPATRKKLIQKFGSIEGVRRARDKELEEVAGEKIVRKIREFVT